MSHKRSLSVPEPATMILFGMDLDGEKNMKVSLEAKSITNQFKGMSMHTTSLYFVAHSS
jgi:hypothetical protein